MHFSKKKKKNQQTRAVLGGLRTWRFAWISNEAKFIELIKWNSSCYLILITAAQKRWKLYLLPHWEKAEKKEQKIHNHTMTSIFSSSAKLISGIELLYFSFRAAQPWEHFKLDKHTRDLIQKPFKTKRFSKYFNEFAWETHFLVFPYL